MGLLTSGGIQLAAKVVMLPPFPQKMTRWLWLGSCMSWGGGSLGIIGGRYGVVVWLSGVLSDGFSLGRALQSPGLGSQIEGEREFSLQTFLRYALNLLHFMEGMTHAPT